MRLKEIQFRLLTLLATTLLYTLPVISQVNIGKDSIPHDFSLLELSTDILKGGLRLPQLSEEDRDGLSLENLPDALGLVIYNTTSKCLEFWNGIKWVSLCASESPSPDETLEVMPGDLFFTSAQDGGGEQSETVTTNVSAGWQITSVLPDWVNTNPSPNTRSTGTSLTVGVKGQNTGFLPLVCEITVTAGSQSKTFTVIQGVVPANVGSAPLLYIDGSGKLQLGRWGMEVNRDNLLLFKFGGVIGFIIPTGTPNEDLNPAAGNPAASRWTDSGGANNVKFNPSAYATSAFANYADIPYYDRALFNANPPVKNISDPIYHNGTNVKLGLGDPCKLVGYTAAQIAAMTPAQIDALPNTWRLPTKIENISFVGADHGYFDNYVPNPPSTATTGITNSTRIFWGPPPGGLGYSGGWFPIGNTGSTTDRSTDANKFLPAAGYRGGDWTNITNQQGTARLQGQIGFFWSSTAYSSQTADYGIQAFGFALGLDATYVYPVSYNRALYGFAIRCVPNTSTP